MLIVGCDREHEATRGDRQMLDNQAKTHNYMCSFFRTFECNIPFQQMSECLLCKNNLGLDDMFDGVVKYVMSHEKKIYCRIITHTYLCVC